MLRWYDPGPNTNTSAADGWGAANTDETFARFPAQVPPVNSDDFFVLRPRMAFVHLTENTQPIGGLVSARDPVLGARHEPIAYTWTSVGCGS
jgi:hypothetical protein